MVRQKILLATTPTSKARVIKELTEELEHVNEEIRELETSAGHAGSPERSLSQNGNTAVPSINPSTQDVLKEKVKLKE